MSIGAPSPVFGNDTVAGLSPGIVSEPPGSTHPFDTPSCWASTVVASDASVFAPGDAMARSVIVPPAGTAFGTVARMIAVASWPTDSVPSAQSTGPVPVQPPLLDALFNVVPAGSVST